jgi:hypothetical protein
MRRSDLRIHIRLAAQSLGREITISNRMTVDDLKTVLADLRRQQVERGIIKGDQ